MAEMKSDKADSLSKEETHCLRLFLCLKICTLAVRNVFDRIVPPCTLESFLRQYQRTLTSRNSNYRCTNEQVAKLFPGGQVVDSTEFDYSLLYKLIRNFVTIPPPTSGWGNRPLPRHLDETDDIERIRYWRNILAHMSNFEICDMDFFTCWSDLSQAIARLSKGGLSREVESLRTKTFDNWIEHEMEEMRNELKEMRNEMREEFMNLRQDVADCWTNIAHNRQNIQNFNNRQDIPICITEEENRTEMPVMPTGSENNLDHLCHGCFEITSLAYRTSTVFMSVFPGGWLRWSNDKSKFTKFIFRKTIEDGRTYFYIIPADYREYWVTIGQFSWYVRCTKGDPTGCINGTWEIKCLEYNNEDCYVLCAKDGNYLSAGSTGRMHGKRGDINEKRRFLIRRIN